MDLRQPDQISEWEVDVEMLEKVVNDHVRKRMRTKQLLHDLADDLEKHHKNARIAKVAGSATGIVSSGLVIGGFIASFFTFGASLVLIGVGAGLGVAAGLTTAGAFATEVITTKLTSKGAERILEDDREAVENLKAALEKTESTWSRLISVGRIAGGATSGARIYSIVDSSIDLAKAGSAAFKAGVEGVGKTAFKAAYGLGKGLAIAGVVFSVVAIPIDLHTMITSAIGIHKKTIPEIAITIRWFADEMPCPSEEEKRELISKIRDRFMQS